MASDSSIRDLNSIVRSVDPIVMFLGIGAFIGAMSITLAFVDSAAITLSVAANAFVVNTLLIAVCVSAGRLVMSQHSISTASHDQATEMAQTGLPTDLNERLDKVVSAIMTLRSLRGSVQVLQAEIEFGMKRLDSNNKSIEPKLTQLYGYLRRYSMALPKEWPGNARPWTHFFVMPCRAHAAS